MNHCGCGCGAEVKKRFMKGHASKLQPTGDRAYKWNGGTTRNKGYVLIFKPDHPRAHKNGYVRRGILVAEQKLGRALLPSEIVHHINQIRDDDRPENLEVLPSQREHIAHHNRSISRAYKLTDANAEEIKRLLLAHQAQFGSGWNRRGASLRGIGRQFGVSITAITDIRDGKAFKHVAWPPTPPPLA